jgi:hypothetical protein
MGLNGALASAAFSTLRQQVPGMEHLSFDTHSAAEAPKKLRRIVSSLNLDWYYAVSTSYVARKLALILFPYRHRRWSRRRTHAMAPSGASSDTGGAPGMRQPAAPRMPFLPPFLSLTSPDLYIPTMALFTYLMTVGINDGVRGVFSPARLSRVLSVALAVITAEAALIAAAMPLLLGATRTDRAGIKIPLLDLLCLCGYVLVPASIATLIGCFTESSSLASWAFTLVWLYGGVSDAVFFTKTLRRALLLRRGVRRQAGVSFSADDDDASRAPGGMKSPSHIQQREHVFLFLLAVVQLALTRVLAFKA